MTNGLGWLLQAHENITHGKKYNHNHKHAVEAFSVVVDGGLAYLSSVGEAS